MIKKIVVFDFDGTLFHTPLPEEGKKIWKDRTGSEFPYTGWWSKKETLDLNIFHIPLNGFVYKEYKQFLNDDNTLIVLATGRLQKLKNEVEKVLSHNNLSFDIVACNTGGDTYRFKTKLFEDLINKYNPSELIMYDDRHEHLTQFEVWARFQPCQISIIDVMKFNKIPKIINPIKK